MMKSYNLCQFLSYWFCPFLVVATSLVVIKCESLSPYYPQCSQRVCQNLPSNLKGDPCQKEECELDQNSSEEKVVTFCKNGCYNFKEAMQAELGGKGCSKLCNLTSLENDFSWSDSFDSLPILACVYGCERAKKNLVTHILHEIKTIRPPQILPNNINRRGTNEISVRIAFSKKTEKDIKGKQ